MICLYIDIYFSNRRAVGEKEQNKQTKKKQKLSLATTQCLSCPPPTISYLMLVLCSSINVALRPSQCSEPGATFVVLVKRCHLTAWLENFTFVVERNNCQAELDLKYAGEYLERDFYFFIFYYSLLHGLTYFSQRYWKSVW